MKSYTSCFIGIPLPDKFQAEFEEILQSLSQFDPHIETVFPKTPHITLCYLKSEAQFDLITISEIIQPLIQNWAHLSIEVGGSGVFTHESNQVIFMEVKCPPELIQLQMFLTKNLVDT